MPEDLSQPRDKQYPDYVYARDPLVAVYQGTEGGKRAATVLLGEWLKAVDPDDLKPEAAKERVHVKFRGGEGYVPIDAVTRQRQLEIYFIDVDQGDSILIQTPDDRRVLIDGGKTDDALAFLTNKYRLDKEDNYVDLEAVVATHSDKDHVGGLIDVLNHPKIAVKRVFHNGLFPTVKGLPDPGPRRTAAVDSDPTGPKRSRVFGLEDRPVLQDPQVLSDTMCDFVEAIDAAEKRLKTLLPEIEAAGGRADAPPGGFVCRRLDRADGYLPPFDAAHKHLQIEVLWPAAKTVDGEPCFRWYGSKGKTVNGNSVVLRVVHGGNTVLLSGDLNEPSMKEMLREYGATVDAPGPLLADVYKAAHHGSQHFDLGFLRVVAPNVGVISSGDASYDEYAHPRAVLLGTITRYSRHEMPAVFSTELAACFRKLGKEELNAFNAGTSVLYERALKGIVHLRSDGEYLCLATVHGKIPEGLTQEDQTTWTWDTWPDPSAH